MLTISPPGIPSAVAFGAVVIAHGDVTNVITGTIVVNAMLSGGPVLIPAPAGTPEDIYLTTGVRPIFPLIVYAINALTPSDADAVVPDGGAFLVSASFVGGSGNPFTQQGAAPSFIGLRLINPITMARYFVFRPPAANEVVWFFDNQTLYRFMEPLPSRAVPRQFTPRNGNPIDTPAVWNPYTSRAERNLRGQMVLDAYDPDHILYYYARVIGAMSYQLHYDTNAILNLLDPTTCPAFFLSRLAANLGLDLNLSSSVNLQRAQLAAAIFEFKVRGEPQSIEQRLRWMGYRGYAQEIWVNPTNPNNFQSPVVNKDGSPTSSPTGAGTDWKEYPHGYFATEQDPYWPSSRLSLHINNADGSPFLPTAVQRKAIANALADLLPSFADIRTFVTDILLHGNNGSTPQGELLGISDTFSAGVLILPSGIASHAAVGHPTVS